MYKAPESTSGRKVKKSDIIKLSISFKPHSKHWKSISVELKITIKCCKTIFRFKMYSLGPKSYKRLQNFPLLILN
jgi:hypothetical protein